MSRKRTVIPEVIDDIELLTEMRDKSYTNLAQEGFKKKELSKALDDMAFYREAMSAIRRPKEKKNKYGNVGMDDLIKIVAKLNQDVKQIKDTQSVVSANEWIKRHGFNDLYEARGKDLDGDGKPEVVVQTKAGKKPVIVNGYTTVPSLFPYRNAYYKDYPSVEKRKEAHKQGINLRRYINDIYDPSYSETGRSITSYNGEHYKDFEKHLKAAGIDDQLLIRPKNRSTYQAFVSRCISPIYQAVRYLNNEKLPFTLTEMASVIWNQFALIPAMVYVYGQDVLQVEESQWKNLRGKRAVKESIEYIVYEYLVDPIKIADFVPTVCEMCNKANLPVEQQHIPLVAKATIAIIVKGIDDLPIDVSKFEEWYAQNVKPLTQALEKQPTIEELEE